MDQVILVVCLAALRDSYLLNEKPTFPQRSKVAKGELQVAPLFSLCFGRYHAQLFA